MRIDGWRSALWFSLCCFLVLSVCGISSANETSIADRVQSLKANLLLLGNTVKELKLESSKALEKQANLETALDASRQDSKRLTDLLVQSQETSTRLSQNFDDYRREARRQILRGWLLGGSIGVGVGVILTVLLGGLIDG